MRGYVLTERGKILVAMLIVLLLIVPSVVLVVYSTTRNSHPAESPETSTDIHQNGTQTVTDDNIEPASSDTSQTGPVSLNIDAGEMTFLFAPDSQTVLDDNTSSMIGQLLSSPKNTNDSKIAVNIPQLPDDETAVLTTVILNAFITHNVSLSDIIFFVYQPEPDTETFEIGISFK